MSLTIELPYPEELRLRKEAARNNSTVEAFAAQLLLECLRASTPAELTVTDEEAQFFTKVVHDARNQSGK